jgi:hypothetical protein
MVLIDISFYYYIDGNKIYKPRTVDIHLVDIWNEWYINEQYHVNPNSPKYTGPRPVDVCR